MTHSCGQSGGWGSGSPDKAPHAALGRVREGFLEEGAFELERKVAVESPSQGEWRGREEKSCHGQNRDSGE